MAGAFNTRVFDLLLSPPPVALVPAPALPPPLLYVRLLRALGRPPSGVPRPRPVSSRACAFAAVRASVVGAPVMTSSSLRQTLAFRSDATDVLLPRHAVVGQTLAWPRMGRSLPTPNPSGALRGGGVCDGCVIAFCQERRGCLDRKGTSVDSRALATEDTLTLHARLLLDIKGT